MLQVWMFWLSAVCLELHLIKSRPSNTGAVTQWKYNPAQSSLRPRMLLSYFPLALRNCQREDEGKEGGKCQQTDLVLIYWLQPLVSDWCLARKLQKQKSWTYFSAGGWWHEMTLLLTSYNVTTSTEILEKIWEIHKYQQNQAGNLTAALLGNRL